MSRKVGPTNWWYEVYTNNMGRTDISYRCGSCYALMTWGPTSMPTTVRGPIEGFVGILCAGCGKAVEVTQPGNPPAEGRQA